MELNKVESRLFGKTELDFYRNENNDIFMTSEQIGTALEYAYPAESVRKIRDRFPSRFEHNSVQVVLTSTDGKQYATRVYNEKGIYEVIRHSNQPKADEFYDWVYGALASIRKTGSYSAAGSIEDLIIMQAQSMKALRQEVELAKEQIAVAHHRIDSLDAVNVIGDMQQRLNAMVRKLAQREGWTFQKAWREFTGAYNIAYRTNLTTVIDNYREKHGLKDLTRPQYLSITDHLEDAIRVVDKLLNRELIS